MARADRVATSIFFRRGARVGVCGAHDARQVVDLDNVRIDDGQAANAQVHELLNEDRASPADADHANVETAEASLSFAAEHAYLPVKPLTRRLRRSHGSRNCSISMFAPTTRT